MNKNFEKNRLDLAYKRQLHYLNAVLMLISIGILSFIGTFIWNRDYLTYGFLLTLLILVISYAFHNSVNKKLKEISEQIKALG